MLHSRPITLIMIGYPARSARYQDSMFHEPELWTSPSTPRYGFATIDSLCASLVTGRQENQTPKVPDSSTYTTTPNRGSKQRDLGSRLRHDDQEPDRALFVTCRRISYPSSGTARDADPARVHVGSIDE